MTQYSFTIIIPPKIYHKCILNLSYVPTVSFLNQKVLFTLALPTLHLDYCNMLYMKLEATSGRGYGNTGSYGYITVSCRYLWYFGTVSSPVQNCLYPITVICLRADSWHAPIPLLKYYLIQGSPTPGLWPIRNQAQQAAGTCTQLHLHTCCLHGTIPSSPHCCHWWSTKSERLGTADLIEPRRYAFSIIISTLWNNSNPINLDGCCFL